MVTGLFRRMGKPSNNQSWIPDAIEFTPDEEHVYEPTNRLSGSGGQSIISESSTEDATGGFGTKSSSKVRNMHQQQRGQLKVPMGSGVLLQFPEEGPEKGPSSHRPAPRKSDGSGATDKMTRSDGSSKKKNPFAIEYESSDDGEPGHSSEEGPIGSDEESDEESEESEEEESESEDEDEQGARAAGQPGPSTSKSGTKSKSNNPFLADDNDNAREVRKESDPIGPANRKKFEEIMKSYDDKLLGFDESKFSGFGEDDFSGAGADHAGDVLKDHGYKSGARKKGKKGKSSGLKRFFSLKGGLSGGSENSSGVAAAKFSGKGAREEELTAADSDYESHSYDHDDGGDSYISGEDDDFDDQANLGELHGNSDNVLTHRELEDELYMYKLETLNLTDACRELAEQLEEAETKLESVQAQATFRIHALEAELQDGHIGMKSLVKMTSTEMDSRLDALRALGKTATVQAEKLRERERELIEAEHKIRKSRGEIKLLRSENRKRSQEKAYLKRRLEELDSKRKELEASLARMTAQQQQQIAAQEDRERLEKVKKKLNDTLEQVGYMKSQLEYKDKEIDELKDRVAKRESEIEEVKEELGRKEHDVVRVELQLERVRKDLLEAASAAKSAEEARVEAEARETRTRDELEESLAALEEVTTKVAVLESQEAELKRTLEARSLAKIEKQEKEQEAKLNKLEKELVAVRKDKETALQAIESAKSSHATVLEERESQIASLLEDVEVQRQHMELSQSMLEEKESLASELRVQLDHAYSEKQLQVAQMEENLAAKSREVSLLSAELEERTRDVSNLESRLEKAHKDFIEQSENTPKQNDTDASEPGDSDDPSQLNSTHLAALSEKENQIDRLERELGINRRQLDAARVELEEKDKSADRLRSELERVRNEKGARAEELELQLEEKNKSIERIRNELQENKQSLSETETKLKEVQSELEKSNLALQDAEEATNRANSEAEESRIAELSAKQECEELKEQITILQRTKEAIEAERNAVVAEKEKEKQAGTQAAATLAATNAARQAEMEMKIERMQKEIDFKKREIDTIKSELQDKDRAAAQLKLELDEVRDDMVNYKERVESEQEQAALQKIADKEYFDDDMSVTSEHTSASFISTSLFSRFSGGKLRQEETEDIDWESKAREKDLKIEQLERTLASNEQTISSLKDELVAASTKFKQDECQRRLLIQRLENENSAYSIKLEVLENEFNEIRKKKEASLNGSEPSGTTGDDTSCHSSKMDLSSISSCTSGLSPMESENRKLKKYKTIYENRISSLQTQLSEIQQIVPELMGKSKTQIQKLETVIQTQKKEAEETEESLREEIAQLKKQNEQLQAATRSRLQASDAERQDEIDQLKMRLEAREATIAKLELAASGGKSRAVKKKASRLLKKKKNKNSPSHDEVSIGSLSTAGHSVAMSTLSQGTSTFVPHAAEIEGAE